MSTLKKKRMEDNKNSKKQRMEESSTEESSDEEEYAGNEQIQVDFEGRSPEEGDFHGVKQLLRQLFPKASIDLSQLSDILIKQKSIGSVVKQCDDSPDSDDDEVDQDDVYGITSVVSLQGNECTKQLQSYILHQCAANAPADVQARITEVLENDKFQTGFLLNERFVNIPPQISVPLLQNLSKEIKKAILKKSLPNFDFYILLCKMYKMKTEKSKKGKKILLEASCIWSNPEEEIMAELAECSFEFSVKGDADTGLGGTWKDTDSDMEPWRMVLLLPAKSLDAVIEKIVQSLS